MHPADLALYHRNPRRGNVEVISGSLRANGQYKPIVVNAGTHTGRPNEVLAGNHTLTAIRDLAEKHPDDERWQNVLVHVIDVDEDRAARIVLADNRTSELGTMDDTALAEMIDSLDGDLDGTGYDDDDLAEILEAAGDTLLDGAGEGDGDDAGDDGEAKYTTDTVLPHYEPQSSEPPPLPTLIDRTRTDELCREIDDAALPEDVAEFLRAAAQRHTVIDFHRVAEFYSHAPAHVQRLMERQALVILDVDDAIREGYLKISEGLAESRERDRERGGK